MQCFSIFLLAASSAAYVMQPPAVLHSAARRPGCLVMQELVDTGGIEGALPWGDPREGQPFGEADGPNRPVGKVRNSVEAYQPRGITDATVIKPQYIGVDDDEPWHASCRSTVELTSKNAGDAISSTIPFLAVETELQVALSKAKDANEVTKAVSAATSAGARPGCPALNDADKLLKAFAKDAEAALKARPKAPKVSGAQGNGWDGMKRGVAKTHDNSVA